MTKNKVKIFKILNAVLALGVCFSLTKNLNLAKATIKSSTQKKLTEEKEIEGFNLKQIVKRKDAKFLVYEHKLSGALAVVYNIDFCNFNGFYFANLEKNSLAKKLILNQMLEDTIDKKFNNSQDMDYYKKITVKLEEQCFILNLDFDFKNKDSLNFILKELKNPSFLKKENLTQNLKNKVKLQINKLFEQHNLSNGYLDGKLNERFIGVEKFSKENLQKEIDNLTIEDLKKEFENKMLPQNTMVAINSSKHKNYKEILKNLSNNYFNYFKKTKEQNNFKHKVEKEAFRKIKINNLTIKDFGRRDEKTKKPKFMARLYYDISNLTKEEKYCLALYFNKNLKNLIKNRLKELGYCVIHYNEEAYFYGVYDTILFDNLIFVDLFGDDEKLFEKETLIKNFKEIIKEITKKAKNLNEEETKSLSSLNLNDDLQSEAVLKNFEEVENFRFSTKYGIEMYIIESFNLTKNPFSPKYFKISKDGELKDIRDKKDFFEKFKNFEKNLNFFLKNEPKYIDILVVDNEKNIKKDKNLNFLYFDNALKFPKEQNTDFYSKERIVKKILSQIIYKNFFKENLINKGLIYSFDFVDSFLCLPESNIKEVEKYIFGEFKEKFKNFKPSEEDFNYFKKQTIENLELEIKRENQEFKTRTEFLNNEKKIRNLAKKNKSNLNLILKQLNKDLVSNERILQKIKHKTSNEENKEATKKYIAKLKKEIKELKENRNNLTFFEEKIKEKNKKRIKNTKNFLKTKENFLEKIKTIKFEDILNLFKKLEFKNISKLEKKKFNI